MWHPVAPRLLRRFLLVMAGYLVLATLLAAGLAAGIARWIPMGHGRPLPLLSFTAVLIGLVLPAAVMALDKVLGPLDPARPKGDPNLDELSEMAAQVEQLTARAAERLAGREAMQTEIQRLSREIELQSQSLANVSHELRTPLTSIVGYTEILKEELSASLTDDSRQHLDTIVRNADVLLNLINNLLDFSRLKAGKLEMTWTSVLMGEVIESAFDMVEPQLKARGLKFVVDLPESPVVVQGSFDRLRQVMVNLLSNAVKFTEHGEVGVACAEVDGRVEVAVWDSGIGIAPSQVPHIFEEFRQADGSIRRKYGGSGLGLAICRSILHAHNGDITVKSEPSKGTRFTVSLPPGLK